METEDQGKGEQHSQKADRFRHSPNPIDPNLRTVPVVVEVDPSPRAEARPGKYGQEGQDGPPDVIDALQASRYLLNAGTDDILLFGRMHGLEGQATRQFGLRLAPVG